MLRRNAISSLLATSRVLTPSEHCNPCISSSSEVAPVRRGPDLAERLRLTARA
jgi:hypothetical protein